MTNKKKTEPFHRKERSSGSAYHTLLLKQKGQWYADYALRRQKKGFDFTQTEEEKRYLRMTYQK